MQTQHKIELELRENYATQIGTHAVITTEPGAGVISTQPASAPPYSSAPPAEVITKQPL